MLKQLALFFFSVFICLTLAQAETDATQQLRLKYNGESAISTQVGVTRQLTFTVEGTRAANIQLDNLLENIDTSIFSLVPNSNCSHAVLHADTQKKCTFILSYTPYQVENKHVLVAVQGNHASLRVHSNPISIELNSYLPGNLKLGAGSASPLQLAYVGEQPLNTNVIPKNLHFKLTNTSNDKILIKTIKMQQINDSCSGRILQATIKPDCEFDIPSSKVNLAALAKEGKPFEIFIEGVNTLTGSSVVSNVASITITDAQLIVTPEVYEISSTRFGLFGKNFDYTLQNKTNGTLNLIISGKDSQTGIQLRAYDPESYANVVNYGKTGDKQYCPNTNLVSLAPQTSCILRIIATCGGPGSKTYVDGCNYISGEQQGKHLPMRDFTLTVTNAVTSEILYTPSLKIHLTD